MYLNGLTVCVGMDENNAIGTIVVNDSHRPIAALIANHLRIDTFLVQQSMPLKPFDKLRHLQTQTCEFAMR